MYALFGVFIVLVGLASVTTYTWLARHVAVHGGKVPVNQFQIPDLLVGLLLVNYMIFLAIAGFKSPARDVHDSDLIANAVVALSVVAGLSSFMHFRGIKLVTQFGLRALGPGKVAGFAILLLVAFYPMMICASFFMQNALGPEAKPQELIKLFSDAAQQMNYRTIIYMLVTGTVIAPIAEEFIFRGYIYGILKRYLGVTAGILINASLFAAVHVNLASLPALFLFAICLTLAYEFTGSILVNMCMHSLFNLCALALVFYVSFHPQ